MSILDTIGDKLIAEGVVNGISGWTLSKCYLPNSVDGITNNVVAVFEREGPGTEPGVTLPKISIHVRAGENEYNVARAKAQEVIDVLDNTSLTDFVFLFLKSNIYFGGVDTNNRPIAIINFISMVRRAP